MKRFIKLAIISFILLLLFAGCTYDKDNQPISKTDTIRLCMPEYSSYVGSRINQANTFDVIAYIPKQDQVNSESVIMALTNNYSYSLNNGQNDMAIQLSSVRLYSNGERGDLYSLTFEVANSSPGLINFSEIAMTQIASGKRITHGVGNWCLDFREIVDSPNIELTQGFGLSSNPLDYFAFSFSNKSNGDVKILGTKTILNGFEMIPEMTVFKTYDDMTNNASPIKENPTVILPNQNKTFKFDYSKYSTIDNPVFIKPLIDYEVGDKDFSYLPLNAAQFLPIPDENILYEKFMAESPSE